MVDVILFAILVAAFIYGWRQGTIGVLASIGAILISYRLARTYSASIAAEITYRLGILNPGATDDMLLNLFWLFIDTTAAANRIVQFLLFIIIFIIVHWLIKKLANLLTGIFNGTILGALNRVLGAFLALGLGGLLIMIIHGILLPTLVNFGIGLQLAYWLNESDIVLPLLYTLPMMI